MDEQASPWGRLHPRVPQFNIEVATPGVGKRDLCRDDAVIPKVAFIWGAPSLPL